MNPKSLFQKKVLSAQEVDNTDPNKNHFMSDRKERTDLPNILKVLYCIAKIKDQIAFNVRQIFLELAGSAVQGFMYILGLCSHSST